MLLDRYTNSQKKPPVALMPWLQCKTSLNEKLKNVIGDVATHVFPMHWIPMDWWSRHCIAYHGNIDTLLIRESIISAYHQPCWYARAYFTPAAYENHPVFFKKIISQTLGTLIFNDDLVRCQARDYYAIDSNALEFYWPQQLGFQYVGHWIRRAHYTFVDGGDFYLMELFFDRFVELLV